MHPTDIQKDERELIELRRLRKSGHSEAERIDGPLSGGENVPDGIHAMLRKAVRESSAHGPDVVFDDETQLLAEGIIDSIGIFSVMSEIEQELGCVLPPEEITAENFRSISALGALVQRLAGAAASREVTR